MPIHDHPNDDDLHFAFLAAGMHESNITSFPEGAVDRQLRDVLFVMFVCKFIF